ncbi:hypothetical protein [Bacillus toyonensis]|uniref:hypothetical protein n=1 Tax=Bacillus toyonensis TaxID=155322 RepID=UPI0025419369|nr:hypothetical protein [Bacillus toyonensis]WIG25006.1 hypothetical protein QPL81_01460 [Bacillus toyonensis]
MTEIMTGLRYLMNVKGQKNKDIAKILDISTQAVSLWTKKGTIPKKHLERLANHYKVSQEYLVNPLTADTISVIEKDATPMMQIVHNGLNMYGDFNVVLQPTSDKIARTNYENTVRKLRNIEEFSEYVKINELTDLHTIFPEGQCAVWGVKSGTNDTTKKQYDKLNLGDFVLFYQDKHFYNRAIVAYKIHSPKLSEYLWGTSIFEHIYFLQDVQPYNLSVVRFNEIVYGKSEDFPVMAFRVLNREQSLQIIDAFDIEADYSPTKLTDRKQSREDILKALLNLENNKELDRDTKRKYRIEQSLLREFLFNGKEEVTCACCQTKLSPEFFATAHIKKRSHCSTEEKLDVNVVMPLCYLGCDMLFEKGLLVVNSHGHFQRTDVINKKVPYEGRLGTLLAKYDQRPCSYWNKETAQYYQWHYKHHIMK